MEFEEDYEEYEAIANIAVAPGRPAVPRKLPKNNGD